MWINFPNSPCFLFDLLYFWLHWPNWKTSVLDKNRDSWTNNKYSVEYQSFGCSTIYYDKLLKDRHCYINFSIVREVDFHENLARYTETGKHCMGLRYTQVIHNPSSRSTGTSKKGNTESFSTSVVNIWDRWRELSLRCKSLASSKEL